MLLLYASFVSTSKPVPMSIRYGCCFQKSSAFHEPVLADAVSRKEAFMAADSYESCIYYLNLSWPIRLSPRNPECTYKNL